MKAAGVAFLILLIAGMPSASGNNMVHGPIEFHPGAWARGTVNVEGESTLAVYSHEASYGEALVRAENAVVSIEEMVIPSSTNPVFAGTIETPAIQSESREVTDLVWRGNPTQPHGIAIYDSERAAMAAQELRIDFVVEPGVAAGYPYPFPLVRELTPADAPGVAFHTESTVDVALRGAISVEFFGWAGEMRSAEGSEYLDSGRHTELINGDSGRVSVARYVRIEALNGSLELHGDPMQAFGHSFGPSLMTEGITALPLTAIPASDLPGSRDANGTWRIEGHTRLENLRPTGDDRIQGRLYADPDAFLVDGQPAGFLHSEAVMPVAAGATVVALVVGMLAKYGTSLAAFFTRLTPSQALEHERRRQLYDYIKAQPGPNFRELVRETGIPAGTCRHHLNVLRRSDLIVEKQHGAAVRFFENHGRYEEDWEVVAVLRDPDLKRVHTWLKQHPGVMQKEFLECAETTWGWSRSTAQHRLKRLQDHGLLDVKEHGRSKRYEARDTVRKDERPFHPLTWRG